MLMKSRNTFVKALTLVLVSTLFFAACTPKSTQSGPAAVKSAHKVEFVILQFNDVYEISPMDNGKVGGISL